MVINRAKPSAEKVSPALTFGPFARCGCVPTRSAPGATAIVRWRHVLDEVV